MHLLMMKGVVISYIVASCDRMKVKVICKKCKLRMFWEWGSKNGYCPKCKKWISIRDVKLADGEVVKLFS